MRIDNLQALYDGYLKEAIQVEKNRKPGEGIFGIGKKPSDDPCHDRFASNLKEWLEAFGEENPDSAEIREVLSLIYRAPKKYPDPKSSFWMLIAVQSLTLGLIPRLSESDASTCRRICRTLQTLGETAGAEADSGCTDQGGKTE